MVMQTVRWHRNIVNINIYLRFDSKWLRKGFIQLAVANRPLRKIKRALKSVRIYEYGEHDKISSLAQDCVKRIVVKAPVNVDIDIAVCLYRH